jgi:hypothetical protein
MVDLARLQRGRTDETIKFVVTTKAMLCPSFGDEVAYSQVPPRLQKGYFVLLQRGTNSYKISLIRGNGMLQLGPVISDDEKRQALHLALKSKTFARSAQLRSFLRYVCEAEIEGRAEDLKEYALGVSALGRSPDYSPSADSCVRTRAYELRHKLRVLYEREARQVPIRIEIRKGSYAPQFMRTENAPEKEEAEVSSLSVPVAVLDPPEAALTGSSFSGSWLSSKWVVAFLLVLPLLSYFAGRTFATRRTDRESVENPVSPAMAAFWKPFLDPKIPLIVSYDTRMFLNADPSGLIVRDARTNQMNEVESSALLNQMRDRLGIDRFSEVRDYTDAGSLHAIFLLTQMLTARQRPIALKRAASLGWDDLWNSNVVFVGRPNLHPGMKYALESGDFVEGVERIRNLRPKSGEAPEYVTSGTHGGGEKFALITRLPGPQPGHHMLILAGAGSEYGWALAEYVTNPAHVKELVERVASPAGELPEAFQVLIRANFESNVPIQIQYVTHHVLKVNTRGI